MQHPIWLELLDGIAECRLVAFKTNKRNPRRVPPDKEHGTPKKTELLNDKEQPTCKTSRINEGDPKLKKLLTTIEKLACAMPAKNELGPIRNIPMKKHETPERPRDLDNKRTLARKNPNVGNNTPKNAKLRGETEGVSCTELSMEKKKPNRPMPEGGNDGPRLPASLKKRKRPKYAKSRTENIKPNRQIPVNEHTTPIPPWLLDDGRDPVHKKLIPKEQKLN